MQNQQLHPQTLKDTRRSWWGGWLLLPLSVSTIILFIFAMQWKDSLIIQRVEVEGARILNAKDVVSLTKIQPQTAMYRVDLFEAQQRLLEQPMIKSATITRSLANALHVVITEREPFASLGGSMLRYVDSDGVLLPHQQSNIQFDVPMISGVVGLDTARFGKVINDPEITASIEVIKAGEATGFNHAISEVNMNYGGDIIMYSNDSGIPVLLGRGEIMKKMQLLKTFWTNFMKTDSLNLVKYVDARFDDQIVLKRDLQGVKPPSKMKM